ncbi:VOC family protein [Hymenobacter armeniacus]|uniref:Glyoxalase n=1 Tax=Hymenobacter armeniacus TaxID=2771358 RepID=A0ABR8K1V2_9BACT|nr:glyoxalase [Hymenobacter armeniacus]MBD2724619.1 glyoxalase [Hymenobacter armeniacus]
MKPVIKSMRPFIGARSFDVSRSFYAALGFREQVLSPTLSVFSAGSFAFYLQNAYVAEWVDNTMVFLEVEDVDQYWAQLVALDLPAAYPGVRLLPVKTFDWGKECFVHDPSGVLWHIGEFAR